MCKRENSSAGDKSLESGERLSEWGLQHSEPTGYFRRVCTTKQVRGGPTPQGLHRCSSPSSRSAFLATSFSPTTTTTTTSLIGHGARVGLGAAYEILDRILP